MPKRIGSSEPVTFRFTSPAKGVSRLPRRAWIPLATTAAAISLSSCMVGGDDSRLAPTPLTVDPKAAAPTTAPSALAGEMQQYVDRMNAAAAKQDKQKLDKLLQNRPEKPVVLASETHADGAAAVKPEEPAGGAKEAGGAGQGSTSAGVESATPATPVTGGSAATGGEAEAIKAAGKPEKVLPADTGAVAMANGGISAAAPPSTSAMSAMSAVNVSPTPAEAGPSDGAAGVTAPAMDGVLDAVRKCAAAHPQNLNYALALQLLETAETGKAGDSTGSPLAPVDQKLVTELSAALQNMAAHPAGANTTLPDRAAPLVEAAKSWESDTDLKLPRLVLASRVDSFGVYNPVEPKFENGKRHVVIIYCEVANFATKKTDDGMYETHLTQQDTLSTEDGLLVWRPNPEDVEDRSRNQRKDFYLVKKLTIPETLAIGKYRLQMSVTDKVSNKNVRIPLDIEIVGAKLAGQ